jgi:hypothetical protein
MGSHQIGLVSDGFGSRLVWYQIGLVSLLFKYLDVFEIVWEGALGCKKGSQMLMFERKTRGKNLITLPLYM